MTNSRLHRLEESKKLHQYLREVNETAEWINEQLHVAAAEDYGKDFEHLEVSKRIKSYLTISSRA